MPNKWILLWQFSNVLTGNPAPFFWESCSPPPHPRTKYVSDGAVNFGVSFFRLLVKIVLGTILLLYVVFVIIMYSSPAARELVIYLHPCKCIIRLFEVIFRLILIQIKFSNFQGKLCEIQYWLLFCCCCCCLYLTKWRVHLKICPILVPLVCLKILSIFIFLVQLVNWEHGKSFHLFYIRVLGNKKGAFLKQG